MQGLSSVKTAAFWSDSHISHLRALTRFDVISSPHLGERAAFGQTAETGAPEKQFLIIINWTTPRLSYRHGRHQTSDSEKGRNNIYGSSCSSGPQQARGGIYLHQINTHNQDNIVKAVAEEICYIVTGGESRGRRDFPLCIIVLWVCPEGGKQIRFERKEKCGAEVTEMY